jgi:starch phosphorylase
MTKPIKILDVKPRIPETLQGIKDLSDNMWFVWNHEAHDLYKRMNPGLWDDTRKNPVELLCRLKQRELENLARDEGFLAHVERVKQEFDRYMAEKPDPTIFGNTGRSFMVAYFIAECGSPHLFRRSRDSVRGSSEII